MIRTFAAINIATRIVEAQRKSQGRTLSLPDDALEIGMVASIISVGVEQDEREQRVERKATVHLLRSKQ